MGALFTYWLRNIRTTFLISVLAIFFSCNKISQKHQIMDQDGYWILKEQQIQMFDINSNVLCDTTFYDAGYFDFATHSKKEKKEYKKSGHEQWDFKGDVIYSFMHPNMSAANIGVSGQPIVYDFLQTEGSYMWDVEQWYISKLKMEFNSTKIEILEHSADRQVLRYDVLEIDRAEYELYMGSVLFTLTLERP
jgi:hypothetical protein